MAEFDTFILFAAEYSDLAAAEADYEAVKDLYYELGLVDTFDAAVVEKKDDGKVKIVKKHEQPTRTGAWVGGGLGLAAGAVIALFPAAAIGAGLLAGTTAGGAALGALAGHAAGGLPRHDLKELGDGLDAGDAGRVVVAAVDIEGRIDDAIKRSNKLMKKEMKADRKELEKEIKDAEKDASDS
ncbi:MAG: hypothetical protein ACK4V6_07515 [Microthrixaceae bacterium]